MSTVPEGARVFDRRQHMRNRARAVDGFEQHDFLFREVAERLDERLLDVDRRFPLALSIGGRGPLPALPGGAGERIDRMITMDPVAGFARPGPAVVADEEWLPFAEQSFDLVVSVLSLHWVNDLPGALIQIRRALKPDGLFIAALFGGQTLTELRRALMEAEIAVEGGVSPRVSPFADVRDGGALLQRAGFALPVADSDVITVTYETPFRLFADLRGMGEQNAVAERRRTPLRRETLMRAATGYVEAEAGDDGRIPATFEVIWLTGWAPDPSQQKPLRPGSATSRLADALGTRERPV
ncbi:MAG: methyltransferase domain-containing protein [Pseudomonadota bacterium]|nr:methyltransferase domain-containing protein [Pseudomonadota bacterium]